MNSSGTGWISGEQSKRDQAKENERFPTCSIYSSLHHFSHVNQFLPTSSIAFSLSFSAAKKAFS